MPSVLCVFGTRPEAIKMAPVVRALRGSKQLSVKICVTGQHRSLLDQVLHLFAIHPDYDLNIMRDNQTLFDVTAAALIGLNGVLSDTRPALVLVHGDTTTTLAAALAAFYHRIPVGHVEAGLRTGQRYSPFPEEVNRHLIGGIADFHFAPTSSAVRNLLAENISPTTIHLTGNTAVDAVLYTAANGRSFPDLQCLWGERQPLLMTLHRRENFGQPLDEILNAVAGFVRRHPGIHVVYPVHPNPNVRRAAHGALANLSNVSLLEPVGYEEMVFLIRRCFFIMTDSGGLQEEAPTFCRPVLVFRDNTERPEALEAGCSLLVGHQRERIEAALESLVAPGSPLYWSMSRAVSPFGDGTAATKIVGVLERSLLSGAVRSEPINSSDVQPWRKSMAVQQAEHQ